MSFSGTLRPFRTASLYLSAIAVLNLIFCNRKPRQEPPVRSILHCLNGKIYPNTQLILQISPSFQIGYSRSQAPLYREYNFMILTTQVMAEANIVNAWLYQSLLNLIHDSLWFQWMHSRWIQFITICAII